MGSGATRSSASLGTPPISPLRDGGFRGRTTALGAIATPIEEETAVERIGDQEEASGAFRARRVPGSPPDP